MNYSTFDFNLKQPCQPLLFEVGSLYGCLQRLRDKRKRRGRLYELAPLVFIATLAKLMGQNQLEAIAHWSKLRAKELCQLLSLKRQSMPHKTTWGRILGSAIEVSELEKVVSEFFEQHLSRQVPEQGGVVVALDGKTIRGTIPKGQTQGVHLLAAYDPALGIVLAQVAVEGKENEIVAAPKLVSQLDLRGLVVTGDALQTQRELSVEIVARGGDYLWFVKDNQPTLLTDVQVLFEPEPLAWGSSPTPTDFRVASQLDKGHGRIEERVLTVSSLLKEYTPWPHLEQAFKLEKVVRNLAGKELYKEVRYGITSLPAKVAGPEQLLAIARRQWSIENQLHWRRDVLLREDWSQLRRGCSPQVNAVLNNVVLGLLSLTGQRNAAAARREMEYDPAKALRLLTKNLLSCF